MIILNKRMLPDPAGMQSSTCWSPVEHASNSAIEANLVTYSGVILEGDLGEKVSLCWLTSLSWAEEEVKMYRMCKETKNLDQNFSL